MKKVAIYLSIALTVITISSCSTPETEVKVEQTKLIEISKKQFNAKGMKLGKPSLQPFENRIPITGKIVPAKDGIARISAPVEGIIKKLSALPGNEIQKGETIVEIGGSVLIDLQQAFTVSSSKMKLLKAEYDRSRALFDENIKSEKDFLLAESAYQSELANYNGLKIKLQDIGLNTSDIEKGNYVSSYKIKSPINGQLESLDVALGQYVKSEQHLAQITNNQNAQLKLALFEKNYLDISVGQEVRFFVNKGIELSETATITRKSNIKNNETKAYDCYAEFSNTSDIPFAINQMVNAEIIAKVDTSMAMLKSALVTIDDSEYFLFLADETEDLYLFDKMKVETGRQGGQYVELKTKLPNIRIASKVSQGISLQ